MQAAFEKVPESASESFRCIEFQVARFAAPWHFHPEYELTHIVASAGARFVGDRIARYHAGDLVLIGPNLPHCWINDALPSGERAHSVVVQFRREFLGSGFFDTPELRSIRTLLDRSRRGLVFDGAPRERACRELRSLVSLRGADRVVRLLALLELLATARDAKPLSTPSFRPDLDEHDASRMNRVYRFIVQHLNDDVRLSAVARVAGLSAPAFCRYFKRAAGKTLMGAVNELRIGAACRLLIERDASVAEACYGSGYNNLTHFNRQFRRLVGLSPRDYKRRYLAVATS